MEFRDFLRSLFEPRVILGAIGVASILFCGGLFLLWMTRSAPVRHGLPTVALTVISVPTANPSPTPSSLAVNKPDESTPLPPTSSTITVGAFVQVVGTGGEGLRLRTEPGLSSQVRLLGREAETFQVRDGPVEADGYLWWYLVSPADESRSGWAVSNYLELSQNP